MDLDPMSYLGSGFLHAHSVRRLTQRIREICQARQLRLTLTVKNSCRTEMFTLIQFMRLLYLHASTAQ